MKPKHRHSIAANLMVLALMLVGAGIAVWGLIGTVEAFKDSFLIFPSAVANQGFLPMDILASESRLPIAPTMDNPATIEELMATANAQIAAEGDQINPRAEQLLPTHASPIDPSATVLAATPSLQETPEPALPVTTDLPDGEPEPTATPTLVPTLLPTPTVHYDPEIPVVIEIPAIDLLAPVVTVEASPVRVSGEEHLQWNAPNELAGGWQNTSAQLGQIGNTVINGHHNIYGEVFRHLEDVQEGDLIIIYGTNRMFRYVVVNRMILPEREAPLTQRQENARWISPSEDERLTLVTCWPYESNTHRVIVVASPVDWRPIDTDR